MRTKDLALKSVYYDQIASGRKKTEYRSLENLYYIQTFLNADSYKGKSIEEIKEGLINGTIKDVRPAGYTHIRFHNLGRTMIVEIKDIRIDRHNKLLCIDLGKILSGARANTPE